MKFCLSSHCSSRYLVRADQIRVRYSDIESIPDLYHRYKKPIILFPPSEEENQEYDWKKLISFNVICKNQIYIICPSVVEINIAKENGLHFFFAQEACTAGELRAMADLGASYAYVSGQIFFDLGSVQNIPIKLRAIPTISYNHALPRKNGICEAWIRPEDLDKYEDLLDTIEFEFCPVEREQTLFKVYAEDHQWPTRLDILVTDLGSDAINRYIAPELIQRRLSCRQACQQSDGICHMCETFLHLAEKEMFTKVKEVVKKEKK